MNHMIDIVIRYKMIFRFIEFHRYVGFSINLPVLMLVIKLIANHSCCVMFAHFPNLSNASQRPVIATANHETQMFQCSMHEIHIYQPLP